MNARKIAQRYAALIAFTTFLTLDLVMFGAFVRLTDSGLGCPDWPGCYGKFTPFGALGDIRAAVEVLPDGPVTVFKAWVEMIHRYVGTVLGMLIIAIVFMAWRYRRVLQQSPALASWILPVVCLQGAFGAWTVTHKLMPIVVTTHLLGGLAVLGLLTWLLARQRPRPAHAFQRPAWRGWMVLGLVLLGIQVFLGGWVSTNYAALACMDFPTCHGEWIPEMDFQAGFSFNRALGLLPSGELISQSALTAIHWVHRTFAWLVLVYLAWLGWRFRAEPALRKPASLLLGFLALQVATGLTSIFLQWPLAIAVLHNGGAAALTMTCVTLLVRLGSATERV
ncbi:MAG: COX15/CtaA family protein [Pigmentiphaga sp.]